MKDVELRIDFQAALSKLAPAQLQGPWQLPTELVRLAIACGANAVEIEIKKARLALRAPGARIDRLSLLDFGTLLDMRAPESDRHQALVHLEAKDAIALAALGALAAESLILRSGGDVGWALTVTSGRRPRLERWAGPEELEIQLQGIRLDATAAEQWLERNGRFAPVPISIGPRRMFRGFRRPLIRVRLHEPLPASLALGERGEVPRLWLLRHGIIATRATVPGYPAFEAAVEMAGVSSPGAASSALREAVQPFLDPLVQAAVRLITQLARHADRLRDSARERASRLLLEAARRDRYRDSLKTIRIFSQILNEEGDRRWVSIADLEYMVRFDETKKVSLEAITADQDPADFALVGRQVLVLNVFERTLLSELLGVTFTTPPARPRMRRSFFHLAEELFGQTSLAWQRLAGRIVEKKDLAPAEISFLEALQQAAVADFPRSVVFCTGDGRAHLTGDGRLLLPRKNPFVLASIRAVEEDPAWLYPVMLGLLGGRELPKEELREFWRSTTDQDRIAAAARSSDHHPEAAPGQIPSSPFRSRR